MKPYGYIYRIVNEINGKTYIGLSVDPFARWAAHLSAAKRDKSSSNYFHNAIKKHGKENFTLEIIDSAASPDLLIQKEIFWIQAFRANVFGYNIKPGGEGGGKTSYQTAAKISASRVGKYTGCDNNFFGRTHSEESRLKIKEARSKQEFSAETRAKIAVKSREYFASVAKEFGAFDQNGILVQSFKQNKHAKEVGFNPGKVSECLSGKRKTHKGFTWRYLEIPII